MTAVAVRVLRQGAEFVEFAEQAADAVGGTLVTGASRPCQLPFQAGSALPDVPRKALNRTTAPQLRANLSQDIPVLCGLAQVAEPGRPLARGGLVTAAAGRVYARRRTRPT